MKKLIIAFLLLTSVNLMANNPLWMRYPAISPDGKQIVFSYKGDIYKVNADGGQATALTTHKAYDYNPVWSPDGSSIAFASNRYGNFDIFLMPSEGGQPKRITTVSSQETINCFSPDGKSIIFSATIQDDYRNAEFPKWNFTELYKVPIEGGRIQQIFTTPAEMAQISKDGSKILYHDVKGTENAWRKHHTSSVTRDIRIYDVNAKEHTMLTSFEGEDRNPLFSADENQVYYLSEKSGSYNVWKMDIANPSNTKQVSSFEKNPVRFLSSSNNDLLCYGYNGEVFTQKDGEEAKKVNITLRSDNAYNNESWNVSTSGASEMAISPNAKEIAFIVRGEVFVTSVEYSTTKRITNTPEQERTVSFSPDGKSILYAGERNGSWNLYKTSLVREDEKAFANATLLNEEVILVNEHETFQPAFSPDGKEVAYIENRTTLKVLNLKSGKSRTVLPGNLNYSYSDGDMEFEWSPDGKWILASYIDKMRHPNSDIALIDVSGEKEPINLTESGYFDVSPSWMMKGEMIIWATDRHGMRSHASWGSQNDIYAIFLTQEAYNKFHMSEEEFKEYKELEKQRKKKEKGDKKDKKKDKKKKKDEKKEKTLTPIKIEFKDIEDRFTRLTNHSSALSGAIVTNDGEKLYYLARFEKGYDLWETNLRKNKTKLIKKINSYSSSLKLSDDGKYLFWMSRSQFTRFEIKSKKSKSVSYKAEYELDYLAEKEYLFEHVWRQAREKFYVKDLHGTDWNYYKENYKQFLPHITNNYDYAEMLSEMLGELNASHTGSGYRFRSSNGDRTAAIGAFIDWEYKGKGLRIAEVLKKGPFYKAGIANGVIIEKIDGVEITPEMDYFPLLNHKANKRVLFSLYDPATKERWDEIIKPISTGSQNQMLYKRWVENNRKMVAELSGGRLGYVHIRSMGDGSFRTIYSDIFGKHNKADGIVIDTRFNGGGRMHADIEVLFSGTKYLDQIARDVKIGEQPRKRWTKPSIMLMGPANYSNAHGTPWVYKHMNIGKLVGMPVPGTMTSVWWETLMDRSIYFGIPQIGYKTKEGIYLENTQLEPDYKVANDPEEISKGRDQQMEKAVKELLNEVDSPSNDYY